MYVRNDGELTTALERGDGWLAQLAKEQGEQLRSELKAPATADNNHAPVNKGLSRKTVTARHLDHLIEEVYLRTLSRMPSATELRDCRDHLGGAPQLVDGMRDLLWALLNTQEFITNH